MNSLENSSSSTSPLSSIEGADSFKKDKDNDKKRSRRAAFRVLGGQAKEKQKTEPEKPLFTFDFNSKESGKKDTTEKPKETETHEEDEEAEVPLENFSDAEELEVAQIILTDKRDNEPNEQQNDKAIESYRSKVIDEGKEPELALHEVLEDNGIDAQGIDPEDIYLDSIEDIPFDKDEREIDLSTIGDEGEVPLEAVSAHDNLSDELAVISSGGGGKKPPSTKSFRSFGGGGNSPRPNPWSSSRLNPNTLPSAGMSSPASYNYIKRDHRDYWSGFMEGGIVGYFVGHRRGRIKTERKLESVKKSLEKQVKKIDKELKSHEYAISKLVKEKKVYAAPEKPRQLRSEVYREVSSTPKTLKKEALTPIPAAEIHIGRLVMSERPKEAVTKEQKPETRPHNSEGLTKKAIRVETMNKPELLKYSEDIIIDGSSLKEIYESQLVGEKGLRRLVTEYNRGGDLKEALKREIVERQIDFERDPVMRDMAAPGGAPVTGTGQMNLEQMIKKASSALSTSQEEVAFLKARAAHEDKEKVKQNQHVRAINAVFLSIIAFLVIVIILLSFLRHG